MVADVACKDLLRAGCLRCGDNKRIHRKCGGSPCFSEHFTSGATRAWWHVDVAKILMGLVIRRIFGTAAKCFRQHRRRKQNVDPVIDECAHKRNRWRIVVNIVKERRRVDRYSPVILLANHVRTALSAFA